jgi:midasin
LDYARRAAPAYGLQRALWDGFSMSFLTQLSPEAGARLQGIMVKHLLPGGQKGLKVRDYCVHADAMLARVAQ